LIQLREIRVRWATMEVLNSREGNGRGGNIIAPKARRRTEVRDPRMKERDKKNQEMICKPSARRKKTK